MFIFDLIPRMGYEHLASSFLPFYALGAAKRFMFEFDTNKTSEKPSLLN